MKKLSAAVLFLALSTTAFAEGDAEKQAQFNSPEAMAVNEKCGPDSVKLGCEAGLKVGSNLMKCINDKMKEKKAAGEKKKEAVTPECLAAKKAYHAKYGKKATANE